MNHETTDTRRTDQDIYEDVIKANQKRMLEPMNTQSTSDTPETDGKKKRICGNWNNAGDRVQDFVLADFARKLERERDEARASLAAAEAWSATLADVGDDFRSANAELRAAIRNLRDVQGRHHTQIATERLFALLPGGVTTRAGIDSGAQVVQELTWQGVDFPITVGHGEAR